MTLNLDEIEQRAQAAAQLAEQATAGPWEAKWDWVACKLQDRDIPVLSGERSTADVRFAAAARTDVPALAADVAALVAEVKRLTAELAKVKTVTVEWGRVPFTNPPVDDASIAVFNALDEE